MGVSIRMEVKWGSGRKSVQTRDGDHENGPWLLSEANEEPRKREAPELSPGRTHGQPHSSGNEAPGALGSGQQNTELRRQAWPGSGFSY